MGKIKLEYGLIYIGLLFTGLIAYLVAGKSSVIKQHAKQAIGLGILTAIFAGIGLLTNMIGPTSNLYLIEIGVTISGVFLGIFNIRS